VGLSIKEGNSVAGRRAKKKKNEEKKERNLCSDNVAGGRGKLKHLNMKKVT
jgi:hypothetical protein